MFDVVDEEFLMLIFVFDADLDGADDRLFFGMIREGFLHEIYKGIIYRPTVF